MLRRVLVSLVAEECKIIVPRLMKGTAQGMENLLAKGVTDELNNGSDVLRSNEETDVMKNVWNRMRKMDKFTN